MADPTLEVTIYEIDDAGWDALLDLLDAYEDTDGIDVDDVSRPQPGKPCDLSYDTDSRLDEILGVLAHDASDAVAALTVDLDPADEWGYEADVTLVATGLGSWEGKVRDSKVVVDADAARDAVATVSSADEAREAISRLTGRPWLDAIEAAGGKSPLG